MNINYLAKNGVISFNNFFIDKTKPLKEQLDNLKEDMLQIEFPKGYILDIGWFPSFNINGAFKVIVIKDFNWDNPFYQSSPKDIDSLENEIKAAISFTCKQIQS